jgi:hypothetical protein
MPPLILYSIGFHIQNPARGISALSVLFGCCFILELTGKAQSINVNLKIQFIDKSVQKHEIRQSIFMDIINTIS